MIYAYLKRREAEGVSMNISNFGSWTLIMYIKYYKKNI